jgi:long-chain acyl-CoA synthetase
LFEDECWSYGEVDAVTDRIADRLIALGLRPGDRAALLFANCPQIVFSYYACFKAGVIAVPINPRMKGPEMAYVLNHSGARVLIGQADLFRELETMRADLQALETCFLTGDCSGLADVREFVELQAPVSVQIELPVVSADAFAAIFYTSGTTARPKGVVHSHYSLERLVESFSLFPFTVFVAVAPLAHLGAFCHLLTTLHSGGTLLLFPKFDPIALLRGIERHRATGFWLLPVMYAVLLQVPNASSYDLSSVEICYTAGDSMPEQIRMQVQETFGLEIVEVCGMTEMIYSTNIAGEGNRPGSIGKPLPGVRMRLADASGNDVPHGETGEILAHGASLMCGYWQDPDATAEAIRDGWLHTGDLAREDEDGFYWFVGRKKDIIIRGGSNIAPAEVEDALHAHPAVSAAGVIGVPDPLWGQAVRAFVALKPDVSTDEVTLKAHLQQRLAAYKVPETIRIVPSLPIGLTGKIHRQTLREWAAGETSEM